MMPHAPRTRVLIALFELAQASEPIDLYSLAEEAGLNLYRTLAELHELSLLGLADARRLRLTGAGLALSVSVLARLTAKQQEASKTTYDLLDRSLDSADESARLIALGSAQGRGRVTQRPRRGTLNSRREQTQRAECELFERNLVA